MFFSYRGYHTLLNADGREEPAGFGIEHLQRLILDDLVEVIVELDVVRVDRVEGLARGADELHLRGVLELRERIDLYILGAKRGGFGNVPILDGGPHEAPDPVRLRAVDREAIGNGAIVSGGKVEVLPSDREVVDEAEPAVVGCAEEAVRNFHHGRAVALQVEVRYAVDRRAVAGQEEGLGVHQLVEEHDLMSLHRADGVGAFHEGRYRRARHSLQKRVGRARGVEIVIDFLGSLGHRRAVEEFQGPDRCLHLVRCRDRVEHLLADLCEG